MTGAHISLNVRKLFVLLVLTASIAGCSGATPYQALGLRGGYKDVKLDDNTYRVTFQGGGATSREIVEVYDLYRCAELTIEKGYDYFIVIETNDGRSADAAYTYFAITRTIDLYTGTKPADNPKAWDARELMKNLEAEINK